MRQLSHKKASEANACDWFMRIDFMQLRVKEHVHG